MGKNRVIAETAGFLSRLRRDVRGNTLAMMAAMLVPLAALSGSAVDLSRMYAVKTRLQQACDVGALAGRKMMTDSSGALNSEATASAQNFFTNNFRGGWFKTSAVSFTATRTADNQVAGTASATVPMTVMTMFGAGSRTVSVTCEARYDVADADIMFVLDTTGSMACTTADDPCTQVVKTYTRPDGTLGYYDQEESGSKLSGLRTAVLSFYDTLASSADPSTHIRYGFLTYTSTVNVGYLLPSSDLVSTWSYQSRHAVDDHQRTLNSTTTVAATSTADCATHESRTPALTTSTLPDGTTVTNYPYNTDGTATRVYSNYSGSPKVCSLKTYTVTPYYRYEKVPFDVSHYVAGGNVVDPTKVTGALSKWQGCIEERDTTTGSTFSPDSLPADLDPDLVPSSDSTRWRPMWPDVVYYRTGTSSQDDYGSSTNPYGDSTETRTIKPLTNLLIANNAGLGYVSCGKPAQRLTVMTRDDVSNYVSATDFKAIGGTYHDTGMIWGTRLISPNGIFASDTAAWPGRQAPNRFIVFMTDGQMAPNPAIYGMYGMEQYDQRVTGNGSSSTDLTNHNARFLAECAAAKARNITVFVVGFGSTLTSQLKTCASPGQAYYASDNDSLKKAFQKIAQQVAMLRISK